MLIALAVGVAGCDRAESQKAATPPDHGAAKAASACTSAGARDLISRFLADHSNSGDLVEVFIAPEPDFEWFSTRDRVGMELAGDRPSLAPYLAERRRQGVEQHLAEFQFNGIDGDHANVSFTLAEGAGEDAVEYSGKAAIHCSTGKFIVWSEGTPRP